MIVFENQGEIDIRLAMLIGVNVKETANPIGFFGTGLKYAIACLTRWGEDLTIQSGQNEFTFESEAATIRGRDFGILQMRSRLDCAQLGFTTDLGKQWEPWMVYRELWCNAQDETGASAYETDRAPAAKAGLTRVIVNGPKIVEAHAERDRFILNKETRRHLHTVPGLEIYEGASNSIFYRGIAVQKLGKPSLYTYNITETLWLTEDRTSGSWQTDPIIARGLSQLEDTSMLDATILAPADALESRLDYCGVTAGDAWLSRAEVAVNHQPFDVPSSVRAKFTPVEVETCPTCGREM